MADLPIELRKYVHMMRGVIRVLAQPNASEAHLQNLNGLIEAVLQAVEPTPLIQTRAQTLRVAARALLAFRRHRFVDHESGEQAVASAFASCEYVLKTF